MTGSWQSTAQQKWYHLVPPLKTQVLQNPNYARDVRDNFKPFHYSELLTTYHHQKWYNLVIILT
jgi:hypothetical protein